MTDSGDTPGRQMATADNQTVVVEGEIALPHTPWDRMPGESEVSYAHFLGYRDLGQDRTIARAADVAHKSRDHFHRLATQWQWIGRAGAWDVEQYRLFVAQSADARREMITRHSALGRTILAVVEARMMTIPIDELSPNELCRLGELGGRLERYSWMEEARTRLQGGASSSDGIDFTHLDEASRVARLEALRAELDRRIRARRALGAGVQDGQASAA